MWDHSAILFVPLQDPAERVFLLSSKQTTQNKFGPNFCLRLKSFPQVFAKKCKKEILTQRRSLPFCFVSLYFFFVSFRFCSNPIQTRAFLDLERERRSVRVRVWERERERERERKSAKHQNGKKWWGWFFIVSGAMSKKGFLSKDPKKYSKAVFCCRNKLWSFCRHRKSERVRVRVCERERKRVSMCTCGWVSIRESEWVWDVGRRETLALKKLSWSQYWDQARIPIVAAQDHQQLFMDHCRRVGRPLAFPGTWGSVEGSLAGKKLFFLHHSSLFFILSRHLTEKIPLEWI